MRSKIENISTIVHVLGELTSRQALEIGAALEQSASDSEYSSWRVGESGPIDRDNMTAEQVSQLEDEERAVSSVLEILAREFEELGERLAEEAENGGNPLPTPTVSSVGSA